MVMTELPSRLTVEARGRIFGKFDLIETIPQATLIVLSQNLPGGLFTASVTCEEGSKNYLNVCGYKLGYPDITELTLWMAKPLIQLVISPPRNIGVYEGSPAGRIRKTVYFYG